MRQAPLRTDLRSGWLRSRRARWSGPGARSCAVSRTSSACGWTGLRSGSTSGRSRPAARRGPRRPGAAGRAPRAGRERPTTVTRRSRPAGAARRARRRRARRTSSSNALRRSRRARWSGRGGRSCAVWPTSSAGAWTVSAVGWTGRTRPTASSWRSCVEPSTPLQTDRSRRRTPTTGTLRSPRWRPAWRSSRPPAPRRRPHAAARRGRGRRRRHSLASRAGALRRGSTTSAPTSHVCRARRWRLSEAISTLSERQRATPSAERPPVLQS